MPMLISAYRKLPTAQYLALIVSSSPVTYLSSSLHSHMACTGYLCNTLEIFLIISSLQTSIGVAPDVGAAGIAFD